MKMDFNNLHINLAKEYNNIINILNNSNIKINNIEESLCNIHNSIGALLACYDNNEIKDLSDKITLIEYNN